ncbi:hypothetical protein ZWY2020_050374 [Hordeum vulgare]|nr:hypothetical protein ZWY2020_050374 [Hordeum vulgare]
MFSNLTGHIHSRRMNNVNKTRDNYGEALCYTYVTLVQSTSIDPSNNCIGLQGLASPMTLPNYSHMKIIITNNTGVNMCLNSGLADKNNTHRRSTILSCRKIHVFLLSTLLCLDYLWLRNYSRVISKAKFDFFGNKIAGSSSIVLLCLLSFVFWLGYKKYGSQRKSKGIKMIESFLHKNGTIHPKRYTYTQVKIMTKSFAEKLGQGGFGVIAVKMLKDYKTDCEDFINEVASISKTSHVNVVTLLGFCLEGSKRALIYDYMPNGSLERYAFNENSKAKTTLGWEKLLNIAVGIALHFDIKPHNILLDQDFCPKISDFGLAKLCLSKESVFSKQFGAVSSKSDVYSYGMVVLEMVGARDKNISANSESSSQYFPRWIYEHLDEYCVSSSEIDDEIRDTVRKMIVVGLWCIQINATDRPTMTRVLEMLEGSTSELELPPKVLLNFK